MMQRITTFLWFNDNAEEAVNFYTSIFDHSKIKEVSRYGDAGPGPKGTVMVVKFELDGQDFIALNGGPHFRFTEAISLVVGCKDQKEIDRYWDALSVGGQQVQCGWLKDKFGLSWQIVPENMGELMAPKDPAKGSRAMKAMLQMKKIDIAALKNA
jgi:predicted 3-demethylubiquinone-9 3-methyltransferase (glyoxalase superfamily)